MKKFVIFSLFLVLILSGCSLSKSNQVKIENEEPGKETSDAQNQEIVLKEEADKINQSSNLFNSAYFALSFIIPSGFEVKESQNKVLIAKSPYYTREIGDDNAFFILNRYNEYDTRENLITSYKKSLKDWEESQVVIDGTSFLSISGTDIGSFEGDGAGKNRLVFFDASWLQIIERPANLDQTFDPIALGNQVLSTLKFSKNIIAEDVKILKNDNYYFKFSSPKDSIVNETLFGEKQMISKWKDGKIIKEDMLSPYYSIETKSENNHFYFFKVIVYPNTVKTMNDILLANSSICDSLESGIVCESNKINNIDAYKITYNSSQAVPGSDYHFIYKGNYYLIQHSIKPSFGSNASSDGEEIFKTFKLLE